MRTITLSLLVLLAASGCYVPAPRTSRTVTTSEAVEPGDADSVKVEISVGVGKLNLHPGSNRLLDATFRYNIPDWKPRVSYEVKAGLGRLTIEQPSSVVGAAWPSNVTYEWDLAFSDKVPLDMELDFGVGKTELDLTGLLVRRLEIDAGVGEGTIDLSGERDCDLDAEIEAGVGRLTVILPDEVGARVEVEGGIGKVHALGLVRDGDAYHNDAWGKSDHSLRLDIEGGIGEVELRLGRDRRESI